MKILRFWHERDACINNLKLNLNVSSTKADYIRTSKNNRVVDQATYTRHPQKQTTKESRVRGSFKEPYSRASLENVSRIPWGEHNLDEESTLRRSRSFAISRENLFYSLDYLESSENKRRRPQLIPRAKLIEKSFVKDSRYESFRVENLDPAQNLSNKPLEIPPDYTPSPKNSVRGRKSFHFQQENIYDLPPETQSEDDSGKIKSLIPNFDIKPGNKAHHRRSLDDVSDLSLPNYYPDFENSDNISYVSQDKSRYLSVDNINWSITEQHESISYDENIVLAKKPEGNYAKPRTIRGPTPYHSFDYTKLPQFNSEKIKDSETIAETQQEQQSSIEFETNRNFDEIKLNNENIAKEYTEEQLLRQEKHINYSVEEIIEKLQKNSDLSCPIILNKPLCHDSRKTKDTQGIDAETLNDKAPCGDTLGLSNTAFNNQIKTLIEVASAETAVLVSDKSEEFKTIVTVGTDKSDISENPDDKNKVHSHNYLKEFLESQKGSKKPLQSFIAKKFSNLTRKNVKSNLITNRFYSLPDITASRNLLKCEKIDRKLRKCDIAPQVSEKSKENRFIVNIGRYFDITAKSSIPVDFEVKIAKVPKKNRKQNAKTKTDKEFIDAVRSINETLHINNITVDFNNNSTKEELSNFESKNEATKSKTDDTSTPTMDPEIQEKVDNMRHYWTKIMGNEPENESRKKDNKNDNEKCKIIEVQTKVNNVKKKFEPVSEIIEEKPPNKVHLAKQLFEPKALPDKVEKISPVIKETCSYFEKSVIDKQHSQNYESLCPSSVEIVHQNNNINENDDGRQYAVSRANKSKKVLTKSNSISAPEFDHVRYKIVKSDLFNKNILANCEKESQFNGLLQYLNDYSFKDLLIDNNIVIIEPIRSKVQHSSNGKKKVKKETYVPPCENESEFDDVKQGIRKHFFYHPIRVNKEVNDDELPNPEVVRQARQFFEKGLRKSQSTDKMSLEKEKCEHKGTDPDKDQCSATDSNSSISDADNQENIYDSLDNNCCNEYVSEDVLEKIREYGTTVTYYGGRVVDQHLGQPILTKVIMEEIKNNEKRCMECNSCRRMSAEQLNDIYQGIKFKLIKSNSCSSRLELVGASNKTETKKIINKQEINKINIEKNNQCIKEVNDENEKTVKKILLLDHYRDKNSINEKIKLNNKLANQPRIIAEERKDMDKLVQWGELKNDQIYACIQFNEKSNQKIKNYDYHEKIKPNKQTSEMEFEPYEVA